MQLINLKSEPARKDWSMQFMDHSHFDELYSHSVRVNKPDGSPLLIIVKNAISENAYRHAYPALKKINMKTENRSTASGISAKPRIRMDGTKSKTTRVPKGWEVNSGVVGYFERQVRFPYCHACAWNVKNPELFNSMIPLFRECSAHFERLIPDRYAVQKGFVDRTHPDFVIPGTVYTTVTVNKNFRTAAHKDAGDLAAGFSNMLCLREGLFAGGELVLPDWRVAVHLDHGDLVMFDAHEFHGNTQIVPISKMAKRMTLVMYYREKMFHCKSAQEEFEFAKNRKPGDPIFEGVT